MKKRVKSKAAKKLSKDSARRSKATKPEMPELVTVMMKIAERLEALEKKMDLVVSQTSTQLSAMRNISHTFQRPESSHHPSSIPQQIHSQSQRTLYQAICADCERSCEVPFRPSRERPVYCKECFAHRKAGSTVPSKNIERSQLTNQVRQIKFTPPAENKATVPESIVSLAQGPPPRKGKKQKPVKKSKKRK